MNKLVWLALLVPVISRPISRSLAAEGEVEASIGGFLLAIVVIIVLVLLNGLFVAAEFAIIGVRSTQLEQLVEEGNRQAAGVLAVVESRKEQDRYIATAQLGITIASLGLAMYGEPQIAHFLEPQIHNIWPSIPADTLHTIGYYIALGLLTYLHVVVGEMVPKSLALSDAAKMSLLLSRPMNGIKFLLSPFVWVLNTIGNGLLRLFRVPPAEGHERVLSSEEIELLVTESAEGGLINEEEQEMILNIFEFGDKVAEQVMTPRRKVEAVPHSITQERFIQFAVGSRHTRFPVYAEDRDHILGIVHLKDLMRHKMKSEGPFDIDLLIREVPAVPENYPIDRLLVAFKERKLHMSIVLDEFGGLAGIVTLEDLVEEVVGEVRDEFDLEKEPLVEISPGVIEVAGDYLVADFDEGFLGEEAALPDVETVGGLVVTKLGRPPRVGDMVIYNDWVQMEVLAVDGRAVARVQIEFPDPEKKKSDEDVEESNDDE